MRSTFLTVAAVAFVGVLITGLMGFVLYPSQVKAKRRATGKKQPPPPRQGLARSLFVICLAALLACLFFGLLLPE